MLERVGISLNAAMEEVAEIALPDTPSLAIDGGDSLEDERTALRGPAFAKFANYNGAGTPELSRAGSPGLVEDPSATGSKEAPYPTDPILTDAQVLMIKNLNSIPQLRWVPASFLPLVATLLTPCFGTGNIWPTSPELGMRMGRSSRGTQSSTHRIVRG